MAERGRPQVLNGEAGTASRVSQLTRIVSRPRALVDGREVAVAMNQHPPTTFTSVDVCDPDGRNGCFIAVDRYECALIADGVSGVDTLPHNLVVDVGGTVSIPGSPPTGTRR